MTVLFSCCPFFCGYVHPCLSFAFLLYHCPFHGSSILKLLLRLCSALQLLSVLCLPLPVPWRFSFITVLSMPVLITIACFMEVLIYQSSRRRFLLPLPVPWRFLFTTALSMAVPLTTACSTKVHIYNCPFYGGSNYHCLFH